MEDITRREFVVGVGVGIGVGVSAGGIALGCSTPGDGGRSLLGLTPGSAVGRWRVADVFELRFGGVPIILETTDGELFQVDVLRRDATPEGITGVANTDALSLYLANNGDGATVTVEEQGLAAMALADELGRRGASSLPTQLLTLRERLERHPNASFSVALT